MTHSENLKKFLADIPGSLEIHMKAIEEIRWDFNNPSLNDETKEIFNSVREEVFKIIDKLESVYKKFISNMVGHTMQQEIDKQSFELFPDSSPSITKVQFIRTKIIYEWISSFYKYAELSWNQLIPIFKIFSTYNSTKNFHERILNKYFKPNLDLNFDTRTLLNKIEQAYNCKIVGSYPRDPDLLVSNLIYEEGLNYDIISLFPEFTSQTKVPEKQNLSKKTEQEYYHTVVIGTKEWNRNDAYVLIVSDTDLKEEERKFYSSSFIILNPVENANINLAAAMVRKNAGIQLAGKYNKMVVTLLEFIANNILTKDFPNLCDDPQTFLYHIGPVVMWNIIQEDMQRRDFGFCYYVEKNNIIKFFPEFIIKKHIIDFWAEKFIDLKSSQVDSYMNYSKGVANIKEAYKLQFDAAASTKRRGTEQTLEEYLKENTGKFFGYRKAQIYRRFIQECVWGGIPEVNSTELVNRFSKLKV